MDLCDSDTYTVELLISVLPVIALVFSEIMPFLSKTKANGILDATLQLLQKEKEK